MKPSVLFAPLLLLAATRTAVAASSNAVHRVPFVRPTDGNPQVVEVLIGTPPQRLKLAVVYEGRHEVDSLPLLFDASLPLDGCRDGLVPTGPFYDPQASDSVEAMPDTSRFFQQVNRDQFVDVISADVLDTQCVHFKFGGQAGGNPSLYHHKIAFSRRL
ncbi:hypothetical protein M3Y99_00223500 [Aphelenchoides fujianensis]|nr:hypothetical protein M3Y99_00223500 [Aphelenchoides fujianensis]